MEFVTYKGKLCEKESDFIWGDYIEESVVKGLYHFWHHQNILARHEGMVYEGGDKYVDKDYKDSLDLHVPVSLHLPEIHNYLMSLQKVLNKYLERFPFAELSRFEIVEPLSLQHYPKGGGFKEWHTERANSSPGNVYRHLVFMTYLNDVPDGGTEWFHQD